MVLFLFYLYQKEAIYFVLFILCALFKIIKNKPNNVPTLLYFITYIFNVFF